jgi:hypothetical protein
MSHNIRNAGGVNNELFQMMKFDKNGDIYIIVVLQIIFASGGREPLSDIKMPEVGVNEMI